MKHLYLVIITIFTLSCSTETKNSVIKLRVSNVSDYYFENIVVRDKGFNNLESGQLSDYQIFNYAYRYDFIELQIEGKTYTIQPIDFVGESKLKNGHYTYAINANTSEDRYSKLSLALIED